MHIHPRSLPGLAAGAVLLLAALPLPAARAGEASKDGAQVVVSLNDGFILQGMDRREGKTEFEDDREFIFIPSGFFFIDDFARRQYFSTGLMRKVDPKQDSTGELKILGKQRDIRVDAHPVPSVTEVTGIGPWDGKWDRTVKFRFGLKDMSVQQHLTTLTPYYARTDATDRWLWPALYLTSELGPDSVRGLLSSHPDFAEDKTLPAVDLTARRFKYCDFMVQAGWYDEAERELDRLLDDKPTDDDKKKAEATRARLNQLRCLEKYETIKQWHNSGQFQKVRDALAAFNDKAADTLTLSGVNTRRDDYKAADKAMADAERFLDDLPKHLGGVNAAVLAEAAASIRADLQPDNLPRLDTFLGQARQAERQGANGQTPSAGPSQLLSFAVTAWLGALPDGSPDTAAKLWHAREFVMKYLAEPANRKSLLAGYLANQDGAASVDDFTRLIPLLPPPEPEPKTSEVPVTIKTAGKAGVTYTVQLPPEYRPSRNYPVLIVLHQSDESPDHMLDRWHDAARDNGYIVVAPEWGAAGGYGYSEREHATVLETLRDLRRRFAVDSDRVFLFGLGQGGVMAFDVGLSHPDLFAGVLPMSAGPAMFSERYYRNGQFLPFYIVDGDRSGDINKHIRAQFEKWSSQYSMLWIQYKGRGVEWYGAEVPNMFDWMRNKKREFPLQQLGMGDKDFTTHRPTDNSFYWVTTDGIEDRYINSETGWQGTLPPATLTARIDLENNSISMRTVGLNQVTVWLAGNVNGSDMVHLDQPLTVRWNDKAVWNKKQVTKSLGTLLEDLAARGDRQRLFVAKLEFQGK